MLTTKGKRDYELILKAKEGDQRAFEQLMNLYSKSIWFEISKLVSNSELANDLMMESMAKAFTQIDSYEPQFAFSTWLKRICVNHTIDSLRKKKLATVSIDGMVNDYGETVNIGFESDDLDPLAQLQKEDRAQAVRTMVAQLKGIYRDLIMLRYFNELSYNEISVQMEIPEGTVKARLHRAKSMLKDIIGDSDFNLSY